MEFQAFLAEGADLPQLGGSPRVAFIAAPLADTVSWMKGTDRGPAAILEASAALECLDDELLIETCRVGFQTMRPLDLSDKPTEESCAVIDHAVSEQLAAGRLPVLIGGEHTVTVPAVTACLRRYPDLHVVQIDAHLDLRDSYEGTPMSHACVMRRLHDLGVGFTQVGGRSFSAEEWAFVKEKGLSPFLMSRIRREPDWIDRICRGITGPVYITLDVDGLDAAVMPATGTPEPDGLSWTMATDLLRALAGSTKIVGFDCVEFAPIPGGHHAAFTAAKLIYRTLGYIMAPLFEKEG